MERLERLREAQGVVIIDGGLATDLEHHGADLSDHLWSARLLRDAPEAIVSSHERFAAAGADVLITASYQASLDGFARVGVSSRDAQALMRRSVSLAREGAGRAGRDPVIAASVGPLGATRADGSEYRGGYPTDAAALTTFHLPRVRALAAAEPDLFAVETIPSAAEARTIVGLLATETDLAAWVTLTTPDGHTTAEGEPLDEILAELQEHPRVVAAGVNCCPPGAVPNAIGNGATIAYPNLGDTWDATTRRWRRDDASDAPALDEAPAWLQAGAWLLGGCCGTTPRDISRLRRRLRSDEA